MSNGVENYGLSNRTDVNTTEYPIQTLNFNKTSVSGSIITTQSKVAVIWLP